MHLSDDAYADLPRDAPPPALGTPVAAHILAEEAEPATFAASAATAAEGGDDDDLLLRAVLRGQVVAADDAWVAVSCGGLHSRWPRRATQHGAQQVVDSDVQIRLHWR